mmetsp:Transcript_4752/g.12195  ORF Transcript_4752/g.12195 Transcript_4752/m.12195 type:complete len:323 (+) Transcript_4752:504-1472(+)
MHHATRARLWRWGASSRDGRSRCASPCAAKSAPHRRQRQARPLRARRHQRLVRLPLQQARTRGRRLQCARRLAHGRRGGTPGRRHRAQRVDLALQAGRARAHEVRHAAAAIGLEGALPRLRRHLAGTAAEAPHEAIGRAHARRGLQRRHNGTVGRWRSPAADGRVRLHRRGPAHSRRHPPRHGAPACGTTRTTLQVLAGLLEQALLLLQLLARGLHLGADLRELVVARQPGPQKLVALASLGQLALPATVHIEQERCQLPGLDTRRSWQLHQAFDECRGFLQQPPAGRQQVSLLAGGRLNIADHAEALHEADEALRIYAAVE